MPKPIYEKNFRSFQSRVVDFVGLFIASDPLLAEIKGYREAGLAKWVRHLFVVSRVHGSNPTPKDFSKMNNVVNSQLTRSQKRATAVKAFPRF